MRHFALRAFGTCLLLAFSTQAKAEQKTLFREYAAVAGETQAAQAAVQILEQGGNAADGAAAAMLALGVTSPMSSGLGGGGFALYYDAQTKKTVFLDFRERAPRTTTPQMFLKAKSATQASKLGALAVAVPGEPAGIEALVKRFGRLTLDKIVQPAQRLADNGFYVSTYFADISRKYRDLLNSDPVSAAWLSGKAQISAGEVLRNPRLAVVLKKYGREGASLFYKGELARILLTESKKRGGILRAQDLSSYQVIERKPLERKALGYDWVSAPPPSAGGYTLVASLALLERWIKKYKPDVVNDEGAWLHMLAESWKGPFYDRALYIGDPKDAPVSLEQLFDAKRLDARAWVFNPKQAQASKLYGLPLPQVPAVQGGAPARPSTSHICVVDAHNNVASVTTSVNLPFGAGFTVEGMFMNDTMDDFSQPSGEANAFGIASTAVNHPKAGRTPVSTMTPTIVFRGEQPVLCVGGNGGSRIVTASEQVALNILLRKQSALKSVSAPRIHHQGTPDVLDHEALQPKTQKTLRDLKHTLNDKPAWHGMVQVIHIRYHDNKRTLDAASDPRKAGYAAGK